MKMPRRNLPWRPLPARAYVPGREPHPRGEGEALPEPMCLPDSRWAEQVEYLWGADLYNAGYFWEAHEAWEALWRVAEQGSSQREFLQALIQCAGACLKREMGDLQAARRLATRALLHLGRVLERVPQHLAAYMGLDLVAFASELRQFAAMDPSALQFRPALVLALPG